MDIKKTEPKLGCPAGHGGVRGADLPRLSSNTQGRFGRMFRALPPGNFHLRDLRVLATGHPETLNGIVAEREQTPTSELEFDDEENFGISAGYTYFGQFVDHDLTFDPVSQLQKENDPEALVDFRTPRFDLDCVYGRGPADQPYMYDPTGRFFLIGKSLQSGALAGRDLPRFQGRALIGDKRNDENMIVSQLQVGFLRFHNTLAHKRSQLSFDEVARLVRWHYQWCVLNEFLPKIVGHDMVFSILPHLEQGTSIHVDKPELRFYQFHEDPFIPIEYTAAAYRFGHSMVRPIYRLSEDFDLSTAIADWNKAHPGEPAKEIPKDPRIPTFTADADFNLNGFREPDDQFVVDWKLFFGDIATDPNKKTKRRVQPAYKLDSSLVNALGFLPEFSLPLPGGGFEADQFGRPKEDPHVGPSNLALRNLLRGQSMGLPSGQTVARAMGEVPVPDEELVVGKATVDATFGAENGINPGIAQYGHSFAGNAPLWYYVLAEAQYEWKKEVLKSSPAIGLIESKRATLRAARKVGDAGAITAAQSDFDVALAALTDDEKAQANAIPVRLGLVGGRIVAETIVGLMLGDRNSYLRQDPNGSPEQWSDSPDFGILKLLTFE